MEEMINSCGGGVSSSHLERLLAPEEGVAVAEIPVNRRNHHIGGGGLVADGKDGIQRRYGQLVPTKRIGGLEPGRSVGGAACKSRCPVGCRQVRDQTSLVIEVKRSDTQNIGNRGKEPGGIVSEVSRASEGILNGGNGERIG